MDDVVIRSAAEAYDEWLAQWQGINAGDPQYRPIPFGIPDLDRILDGLYRGQFLVVAGSHKGGKSTLIRSLIAYWVGKINPDEGIFIIPLEETRIVQTRKFISRLSDIDHRLLRKPVAEDQILPILEAGGEYIKWPLYFVEGTPNLAVAKKKIDDFPIKARIVIVDTIQLTTADRISKRNEQLEANSRLLKLWANNENISTVAVSQMARDALRRGKIDTNVLAGTQALVRDADIGLFLTTRKDPSGQEKPHLRTIEVALSRDTDMGIQVDVFFNAATNTVGGIEFKDLNLLKEIYSDSNKQTDFGIF